MDMNKGASGSIAGSIHDQGTRMDGVLSDDEGVDDFELEDVGNLSDQRESVTCCNQLMATEKDNCVTLRNVVDNCMCCYSEPLEPPSVGMKFPTWEAADKYYRMYGKQQGFGVIMPSSTYSRLQRKRKINTFWKCECSGKPSINRRSRLNRDAQKGEPQVRNKVDAEPIATRKLRKSKKCNCPALMYASVNRDGEWVVRKVVLEHKNHIPVPREWKQAAMHNQEMLTAHVDCRILNNGGAGSLVPQVHHTKDSLDEMATIQPDMQNEIARDTRLNFLDGDGKAMIKFFEMMHMDNQNFYHSFRLDGMGKLQDVIWIDSWCRAAYEEFGDVVWFDTTNLRNDYHLPLVNFIGVNHHGQMILLGCALISHDDVETFMWVFSSWLVGMAGKAPQGILTDEATALSKALGKVMPGTRHRWCLWHILQKLHKELGMYREYDAMTAELKDLIYESSTGDEFERRWKILIDQYGLADNAWLARLYEERSVWVPTYNKDFFWAGMRSPRRVESAHSFFDGYVGRKTRLCEFVEKYCFAMEKRLSLENDADTNCAKYACGLATEFPVEQVLQKLYTYAKFVEVQDECKRVLYCNGREEQHLSGSLVMHKIEDRVTSKNVGDCRNITTNQRRLYRVTFDTNTNDVWCDCKMFETSGILCRHSIRVWDLHYVLEVPRKYILDRWRKDLPRKHTRVKVVYNDPSKTEKMNSFERMMCAFEPVAGNAMGNKDAEAAVMECIVMADTRVRDILGMQYVDASGQCIMGHRSSDANIGDGRTPNNLLGTPTGENINP